jgi:hypothetical protein
MKAVVILFSIPFFSVAQSVSCPKTSLLYSRELFPGEVTVARAIALSGYENECNAPQVIAVAAIPQIKLTNRDTYQYYPLDEMQQDILGRDMPLTNATDQLVKHLVFDK